MMTVIIGTPDSGKSALAEELALKTGDPYRYYLATMKVMDDAAAERVAKHRTQRAGKGFVTVERELGIADLAESFDHAAQATVLLECVSNLVGNEMHDDPRWANLRHTANGEALPSMGTRPAAERFVEAVVSDIVELSESVHHLIVVTNTYEDDGSGYDDDTRLYVKLLNEVNERLLQVADRTIDLR